MLKDGLPLPAAHDDVDTNSTLPVREQVGTRLGKRIGGIVRWCLGVLFFVAKGMTPKKPLRTVLCTFPDYDDTARAFVEYLGDGRAQLVLLVAGDPRQAPAWVGKPSVTCIRKASLRGIWAYVTARYVFFTHGCFSYPCLSSRQCVVNLWHGMPIKKIGLLDPTNSRSVIPRAHVAIATNREFRGIIAAAFGMAEEDVRIADHPRNDVLEFRSDALAGIIGGPRRVVAWLPTYRSIQQGGDRPPDGDPRADILSGGIDLGAVERVLETHQALCIVKPHPMSPVNENALARYVRIRVLTNAKLEALGVTTYGLLSSADVLISDVSSVVFDWQGTGRPSVLFMSDIAQYASGRGFVADPRKLLGRPILETIQELASELDRILGDGVPPAPEGSSAGELPRTRALFSMIAPEIADRAPARRQ